MLRLTFLIRRRGDLTRAEFQSYWREHHGPLMAGFSNDLDVLRYVQCHTTDDDHSRLWGRRGDLEEPYDGVAEVWWESKAAFLAAGATPEGRAAGKAMLDDEHNFMDLEGCSMWASYEYPQVNPSPEDLVATERSSLLKLYFPLRHVPSLSLADAQHYWPAPTFWRNRVIQVSKARLIRVLSRIAASSGQVARRPNSMYSSMPFSSGLLSSLV